MEKEKTTSTISILMTSFLLMFLFVILAFLWYYILGLSETNNFMAGIFFWIVNCFILIFVFPVKMILSRRFLIGFYAPIVMVTVVYTLLFLVFMTFFLLNVGPVLFILMNLILLFLYFIIVIPMIISGMKN